VAGAMNRDRKRYLAIEANIMSYEGILAKYVK